MVKERSDVYMHTGLLYAFAKWCERHGKKLTEDKIALILSHEMAHIEQGTQELGGKEERTYSKEWEKDRQNKKNLEYDADRVGVIRMAEAGYNPRNIDMSDIFGRYDFIRIREIFREMFSRNYNNTYNKPPPEGMYI